MRHTEEKYSIEHKSSRKSSIQRCSVGADCCVRDSRSQPRVERGNQSISEKRPAALEMQISSPCLCLTSLQQRYGFAAVVAVVVAVFVVTIRNTGHLIVLSQSC